MAQPLYTMKQAAKMLSVSVTTLRRLVYNREISCYQITDRRRLFSEEHIADFLKRREVRRRDYGGR